MANNITNNATNNNSPNVTPVSGGNLLCCLPGCFTQNNSTNLILGLNFNTSVWFVPFMASNLYTMTALKTYVVTGAAASTITLGVYGIGLSGLPSGAPLVVGQAASTAQGTISIAVSLPLNPNTVYWAAIQVSTNTLLATQATQVNINNSLGNYISVGVGLVSGALSYTNAYSAGTLPTVSPVSVNITQVTGMPVIYYL